MTIDQFILSNNIQIGDRIIFPKSGLDMIQHHVIYMGVINYSHTFIENKENIGVRLAVYEICFYGVKKITRIERFNPSYNYSRTDLFRYALSKLGTPYRHLYYNCEHLANELQHRVPKSPQVKTALGVAAAVGVLLLLASGGNGKGKK